MGSFLLLKGGVSSLSFRRRHQMMRSLTSFVVLIVHILMGAWCVISMAIFAEQSFTRAAFKVCMCFYLLHIDKTCDFVFDANSKCDFMIVYPSISVNDSQIFLLKCTHSVYVCVRLFVLVFCANVAHSTMCLY